MNRPIFFCHIPKTGGTSVRLSLASHFEPWETMPGPGMMRAAAGHYPKISVIAREMNARGESIKFMCGHYHFSSHQFLKKPLILVVLREPVAQVISHMRHFIAAGQFTAEHCLKTLDAGKCPVQNNVMTRYLGGSLLPLNDGSLDEKHRVLMNGPISDSRVDEAIENLVGTGIIGFTDRMCDFIRSVEKALNIPIVEHRANEGMADMLKLSQSQMATLMELNRFDLDLYERAKNSIRNR